MDERERLVEKVVDAIEQLIQAVHNERTIDGWDFGTHKQQAKVKKLLMELLATQDSPCVKS